MTITEKIRGVIHNKVWVVTSIRNNMHILTNYSLVVYSGIMMTISSVIYILVLLSFDFLPSHFKTPPYETLMFFLTLAIYIVDIISSLFYFLPIILFLFIEDWKTRYRFLFFHFICSSVISFIFHIFMFNDIKNISFFFLWLIIIYSLLIVPLYLFCFLVYLGCDFYNYQAHKHIFLEQKKDTLILVLISAFFFLHFILFLIRLIYLSTPYLFTSLMSIGV